MTMACVCIVLWSAVTVIVVDWRWFAGSMAPVPCITATPAMSLSTVNVADVVRVVVIAPVNAAVGSGGEGDGLGDDGPGAALASATGAAFVPGLAQAPAVASAPANTPTTMSLLDLIASSSTPCPAVPR